MRVDWRRTVPAPPSDGAGNVQLVALLRDEIAEHGPITFARFMERALYEPDLGYYASNVERPTRAGDFLTAPELHPIFGHVLARQVDEIWRRLDRPRPFALREYGAGSRALFLAVLDGLLRIHSPLAESIIYQPIDKPLQLATLAAALADAGQAERLELQAEPDRLVGCVVANEFLDALPVHRVARVGGNLHELYVDSQDGAFIERPGELSDDRLGSWFELAGVDFADGHQTEVNLAMLDWLAEVGRTLERGCVLVFDYGARAADLYGPERPRGTVRSFSAQHVSSDVLAGVGLRDLTAHVDLDALERGARAAGLEVLGAARQSEFLLGAGLEQAYAELRSEADRDWDTALALRSAVGRLLDPRALGGYWAVVIARGISGEPPLSGLAGVR